MEAGAAAADADDGPAGITPAGATGTADRPITYVDWFDAARFANWMANGQPAGPQETTTTENQWYKAVFYDPSLRHGRGGYYRYATRSKAAPGNVIGEAPNQVNYIYSTGP